MLVVFVCLSPVISKNVIHVVDVQMDSNGNYCLLDGKILCYLSYVVSTRSGCVVGHSKARLKSALAFSRFIYDLESQSGDNLIVCDCGKLVARVDPSRLSYGFSQSSCLEISVKFLAF